jgi:hypothetical protein
MLSFIVVNLVYWHCGMHHMRLNGLFLHDGLDGLMDMVVGVLASDSWHGC